MAVVETYTIEDDQVVDLVIAAVTEITVPNGGPALIYTSDEMSDDGDMRTRKDGSFLVETSSRQPPTPGGNWGYTEQVMTLRVLVYRSVKGIRLSQARRDMVRLQAAIRRHLTGHANFAALTGWRMTDNPAPARDSDDWYRIEVGAEATYYTRAYGRAA